MKHLPYDDEMFDDLDPADVLDAGGEMDSADDEDDTEVLADGSVDASTGELDDEALDEDDDFEQAMSDGEPENEYLALNDREVVEEMAANGELDSMLVVNERGDVISDEEVFPLETVDSGASRPKRDDAEMGMGAEAHSAEEMEDAAVGDAIPGKRGLTRDGQAHGSAMFDELPGDR